MAFLTDAELNAIRVTRMILHVVGNREQPFEPQPEVPVGDEELFFRSRIIAEAADGVHQFTRHSRVRPILEQVARGEIDFERGGQELAELFRIEHPVQSTSGAFFVFELDVADATARIYALVKYDYREAVELAQAQGRNVLRTIVQAFVKEKRAVQKFCIVRVRNGSAEPVVSASDRMHEAPDLTDYFERYLGVERNRSTEELSQRLGRAIRDAAEAVRAHLPVPVPTAIVRAKQALQARNTVTNDDVVDALLHAADRPADEATRAQIETTARRCLRSNGLQDVEFRPDPATLQVRPRQVVRTAEDVRLEFPAEQLGNSVTRQDIDGRTVFTVTTNQLLEDGTVRQRIR